MMMQMQMNLFHYIVSEKKIMHYLYAHHGYITQLNYI